MAITEEGEVAGKNICDLIWNIYLKKKSMTGFMRS